MAPKRPKSSPSVNAARKAKSFINGNRLTNREQAESLLPEELQWAFQKGRKSIMEPLENFGEEYIEKNIDPRGGRANIRTQDPTLAIYPEDTPEYAPAGYKTPGLYEVPTKTSNPDRPRTVAAAYSPERSVLTVMFRDSTLYNYYDVDIEEWITFRDRDSKWQYIRDHLDNKPRGPASINDLPSDMRAEAYTIARAAQIQKATRPR